MASFGHFKNITDVKNRLNEFLEADEKTRNDVADVVYNTGCVLLEKGKREDAIEAFELAVKLNPRMAHAHYNLAQEFLKKEDGVGAIRELEKVIEINPDDFETRIQLADVYRLNRQPDEEIRHYQYVNQRQSPFKTEASVKLMKSLWGLKRYREAISSVRLAGQADFAEHLINYIIGHALRMTERFDEAVEYLEKAVSLKPRDEIYNLELRFARDRSTIGVHGASDEKELAAVLTDLLLGRR